MHENPLLQDPLSGILNRLCGSDWNIGVTTFRSPWSVEIPSNDFSFYVVAEGEVEVELLTSAAEESPLRVTAGTVVLLPHGTAHLLCDRVDSPMISWDEAFRPSSSAASRSQIRADSTVTIVHGHLPLTSLGRHRFDVLWPSLIRLEISTHPLLSNMAPLLDVVTDEQRIARPGWRVVAEQLIKTLFAQAVRCLVLDHPSGPSNGRSMNWFQAALDVSIGPVLALLHDAPEKPWTVTSLARRAHMAKSAFSERFRQAVGQPPLKYLTEYRIHKACHLLRGTELGVKEIAGCVGYESASSFSNAFKRWVGVAPADYRKNGHRTAPAANPVMLQEVCEN